MAPALAATSGGRAEAPLVDMNYTSLGDMAARYCEIFKCDVDMSPSAMSYPIVVPFYSSESKTYLAAQLKAFAHEHNYSCGITPKKIYCVAKKETLPLIDSTENNWSLIRSQNDEVVLQREIIKHNQLAYKKRMLDSLVIDTLKLLPSIFPDYLYKIKVLIKILEYDLGYSKLQASYISDFYSGDFVKDLKYGLTEKDLQTSQTAENGVTTNAYKDKLQGLQIEEKIITLTVNNRDLQVKLFGGSQSFMQIRKECQLDFFGFSFFCGLIQTEIFISLE
jgi:hypothetical protein